MTAPDPIDLIELQDRLSDVNAHLCALRVFAAGLYSSDKQASSGLSAILDGLEDRLDDAIIVAKRGGDDGTDPEPPADAGSST